jgi:hypothetical protein
MMMQAGHGQRRSGHQQSLVFGCVDQGARRGLRNHCGRTHGRHGDTDRAGM